MGKEKISRRDLLKSSINKGTHLMEGIFLSRSAHIYPHLPSQSHLSHFDLHDRVEEGERDPNLTGIKQTKLAAVGLENRPISPVIDLTVNNEDFSETDAYRQLDRLCLNVFSRLEQMPAYTEIENNLLGALEVISTNRESVLAARLRGGEDVIVEVYGIDSTDPGKGIIPLQLNAKNGWGIRAVAKEGIIMLEGYLDGTQKSGVTFTKDDDGRLLIDIFHADEKFPVHPEYPGLRTYDKAMSVAFAKDVYEALKVLIFTKGEPYLWDTYREDIEQAREVWGNPEAGYTIPDLAVPLAGTYWPLYGDFIGPTPLQLVAK